MHRRGFQESEIGDMDLEIASISGMRARRWGDGPTGAKTKEAGGSMALRSIVIAVVGNTVRLDTPEDFCRGHHGGGAFGNRERFALADHNRVSRNPRRFRRQYACLRSPGSARRGAFRRRYRATQGRGFQPDASDCLLKSVDVTKGVPRYAGTVPTVVRVTHSLPPGSVKRS